MIEVNHQSILELIDRDEELKQVCTGSVFTEGPIWNPRENCLYFSDVLGNKRMRWSKEDGLMTIRDPNNVGNGMTYDCDGNLYVCEHATSQLIKETPDGQRIIVASHYEGKELNSPNDVVTRNDGVIYFTDPGYGRSVEYGDGRKQELNFQGVYRVTKDGVLHLEADDFDQPNGLCFSPDEKILYVDDSPRAHIRMFDVARDGSLTNSRIFAVDIGDGTIESGLVDGMKCDERGNVYVTGPRGIWIFNPEGKHLGTIEIPEPYTANLNWGGPNWDELYCTSSTSVYCLKMKVRGYSSTR